MLPNIIDNDDLHPPTHQQSFLRSLRVIRNHRASIQGAEEGFTNNNVESPCGVDAGPSSDRDLGDDGGNFVAFGDDDAPVSNSRGSTGSSARLINHGKTNTAHRRKGTSGKHRSRSMTDILPAPPFEGVGKQQLEGKRTNREYVKGGDSDQFLDVSRRRIIHHSNPEFMSDMPNLPLNGGKASSRQVPNPDAASTPTSYPTFEPPETTFEMGMDGEKNADTNRRILSSPRSHLRASVGPFPAPKTGGYNSDNDIDTSQNPAAPNRRSKVVGSYPQALVQNDVEFVMVKDFQVKLKTNPDDSDEKRPAATRKKHRMRSHEDLARSVLKSNSFLSRKSSGSEMTSDSGDKSYNCGKVKGSSMKSTTLNDAEAKDNVMHHISIFDDSLRIRRLYSEHKSKANAETKKFNKKRTSKRGTNDFERSLPNFSSASDIPDATSTRRAPSPEPFANRHLRVDELVAASEVPRRSKSFVMVDNFEKQLKSVNAIIKSDNAPKIQTCSDEVEKKQIHQTTNTSANSFRSAGTEKTAESSTDDKLKGAEKKNDVIRASSPKRGADVRAFTLATSQDDTNSMRVVPPPPPPRHRAPLPPSPSPGETPASPIQLPQKLVKVVNLQWTHFQPSSRKQMHGRYSGTVNGKMRPHGKGSFVLLEYDDLEKQDGGVSRSSDIQGVWSDGRLLFEKKTNDEEEDKLQMAEAKALASTEKVAENIVGNTSSDSANKRPQRPTVVRKRHSMIELEPDQKLPEVNPPPRRYNTFSTRRHSDGMEEEISHAHIYHQKQLQQNHPMAKHKGFRNDYALGSSARCNSHMVIKGTPNENFLSASELQHHDFAFVKRSDGEWTYSILAYRSLEPVKQVIKKKKSREEKAPDVAQASSSGEEVKEQQVLEECMMFVMNAEGSTKLVKRKHWADCVRQVSKEYMSESDLDRDALAPLLSETAGKLVGSVQRKRSLRNEECRRHLSNSDRDSEPRRKHEKSWVPQAIAFSEDETSVVSCLPLKGIDG